MFTAWAETLISINLCRKSDKQTDRQTDSESHTITNTIIWQQNWSWNRTVCVCVCGNNHFLNHHENPFGVDSTICINFKFQFAAKKKKTKTRRKELKSELKWNKRKIMHETAKQKFAKWIRIRKWRRRRASQNTNNNSKKYQKLADNKAKWRKELHRNVTEGTPFFAARETHIFGNQDRRSQSRIREWVGNGRRGTGSKRRGRSDYSWRLNWLLPSVRSPSHALCRSPAAISYGRAVTRFTNFLHIRSVMCVWVWENVLVCVCADVIAEEETTGIGSHTTLRIIVMTAYLAVPTNPKHTKSNDKFFLLYVCVCVWLAGTSFLCQFVVFKTTLKWSNEFRTAA